MAKQPHRLLDPANFWLYSFYVILLSIASSALSEVLKGTLGESSVRSMGLTALACFLLTFGLWLVWHYEFRRRLENAQFTIVHIQPKQPVPSSALIALCGPSLEDKRTSNPAYIAALYHRGTPPDRTLQHLWLITSHSGAATAKWINEQAQGWGVTTHSPVVLDDTWAIDIIRLKVEGACLRPRRRAGRSRGEGAGQARHHLPLGVADQAGDSGHDPGLCPQGSPAPILARTI